MKFRRRHSRTSARPLSSTAALALVVAVSAFACGDTTPLDAPDTETAVSALSDWDHEAEVHYIEESGQQLEDYEVRLEIDTETLIDDDQMQSDCADLRFVDDDGDELDHWLVEGCGTESTEVWVSADFDADAEGTFTMAWGNPEAEDASDMNETMTFGETFEDGEFGEWTTDGDTRGSGGDIDHEIIADDYVLGGHAVDVYADGNCMSSPYDGSEVWIERELELPEGRYMADFEARIVNAGNYSFCSSNRTEDGGGLAVDGQQRHLGDPSCIDDNCSPCTTDWTRVQQVFDADGQTDVRLFSEAGDCDDRNERWDKILVRSHAGAEPTVWLDTQPQPPAPPALPEDPQPEDGAEGVELAPDLEVTVSHPDGEPVDVTLLTGSGETIATFDDVDTNTTVTVSADDHDLGTETGAHHEWYAVASDDQRQAWSPTWEFTTVHEPDEPAEPRPADGAVGDPDGELSVLVDHHDDLAMDVTFFLDDGDGFEEIGTDTDVQPQTRASNSADLEPLDDYEWYVVVEADGFDTVSDTWSFETGVAPSFVSVDWTGADDEHALSVEAVVDQQTGAQNFDTCELAVTSYDGVTRTVPMAVDRDYGDETEIQCQLETVRFDDHDQWDHATVVERDLTLQLSAINLDGISRDDTELRPFPNSAPEIVEGPTTETVEDPAGLAVSVVAEDPRGGPEELGEGACIVEHRPAGDENADWNEEITDIEPIFEGDYHRGDCRQTLALEDHDDYSGGEEVEFRVGVEDYHGATEWSEVDTSTLPAGTPDHVVLSADDTDLEAGDETTIEAALADRDDQQIAGEAQIILEVDGRAHFESTDESTVELTTDEDSGTAEATLTSPIAESVIVEVAEATLEGEPLAETRAHERLTVDFALIDDLVDVVLDADPATVAYGEPTIVAATLTSNYSEPLTDLQLEPDLDNLHIDHVEGAHRMDDGDQYHRRSLEPDASVDVLFHASLADDGDGSMSVTLDYSAETTDSRAKTDGDSIEIEEAEKDEDERDEEAESSGCTAAGNSSPGWMWALLIVAGLLVVRGRRNSGLERALPERTP